MLSRRYRKERPLCRQAIESMGLRLAGDGVTVYTREGAVTGVSAGIRTQLRKQHTEQPFRLIPLAELLREG